MGKTGDNTRYRRVYYFINMEETLKEVQVLQQEAMSRGISFDIFSSMSTPNQMIEVRMSYFKGGTVQENRSLTTKFGPKTNSADKKKRFDRIEKFIKDIE